MKKMKVPKIGEKKAKKSEKKAKKSVAKKEKSKENVKTEPKPYRLNGHTVNELIIEKCITLKQEGRWGTEAAYEVLLHVIEKYYGWLFIRDVKPSWAVEFHKKLVEEKKSPSTIRYYFALLQSITNFAAYLGLTEGDIKLARSRPYELDKVKLAKPRTRQNKYLRREDMDKLWLYWLEAGDYKPLGVRKWLGLFLASYLCNGCNAVDLVRLRYDDEYYCSGKQLFGFFRQKTKNTSSAYVRCPITPKLREIIERIGDPEVRGGLVFGSYIEGIDPENDLLVLKKCTSLNAYASRVTRNVCNRLGLRDDVSMTFARHSYASILNNEGCNFAMIERALGHRLEGVADHYICNASIEKLMELNSHLFTV